MRENGLRAIGGLAQRLTSGIAKGRRGSIARLRAEWSAIVGPELSRVSRPEALLARHGRTGKVLRLRVPGASALEIQHLSGQLVERVNGYFGHRMVDDIRLVQGAIAAPPAAPPVPAPDPATLAEAARRTASVKDPDLRLALTRLGARLANRRHVLAGAFGGVLGAWAIGRDLRAQDLSPDKLLGPLPGDHILGRPDAPNILIDYASLTCPHCATFQIAVMPALRKQWINTGKLKLIHRHFPSDVVATRAAQLAECAGPDKFFARIDLLYRKQVDWLSDGDPLVEMVRVLAKEGVTQAQAHACYADDRLLDKVVADVQTGQTLGVTFTPTLFINEHNYGNPGGVDAISAILRQVGR